MSRCSHNCLSQSWLGTPFSSNCASHQIAGPAPAFAKGQYCNKVHDLQQSATKKTERKSKVSWEGCGWGMTEAFYRRKRRRKRKPVFLCFEWPLPLFVAFVIFC